MVVAAGEVAMRMLTTFSVERLSITTDRISIAVCGGERIRAPTFLAVESMREIEFY